MATVGFLEILVEIDAGADRGAGMSLVWSIHYFFRALFRSDGLWLFWRILGGLLVRSEVATGGSQCRCRFRSVFFLGRRSNCSLNEKEIIAYFEEMRSGRKLTN